MRAEFTKGTAPKARERVGAWLAMRALDPDLAMAEAARRMGIHPTTLSACIKKGVKEGWLEFVDPLQRLEHEIIPKVVDNISYYLDQKDHKMTIEVAKGTVFKQFADANGLNQAPPVNVLALKIESPSLDLTSIPLNPLNVVGTPKSLPSVEGIVIETKEEAKA